VSNYGVGVSRFGAVGYGSSFNTGFRSNVGFGVARTGNFGSGLGGGLLSRPSVKTIQRNEIFGSSFKQVVR
jgi:hypothetical protein